MVPRFSLMNASIDQHILPNERLPMTGPSIQMQTNAEKKQGKKSREEMRAKEVGSSAFLIVFICEMQMA